MIGYVFITTVPFVLPFMCELGEKCLPSRLIIFLGKTSIFSPHQYGFTKGKSTQDALAAFTDHIYDANDNRQSSISVFVDCSKTVDTVDHKILLEKTGEKRDWRRSTRNVHQLFNL